MYSHSTDMVMTVKYLRTQKKSKTRKILIKFGKTSWAPNYWLLQTLLQAWCVRFIWILPNIAGNKLKLNFDWCNNRNVQNFKLGLFFWKFKKLFIVFCPPLWFLMSSIIWNRPAYNSILMFKWSRDRINNNYTKRKKSVW